MGDMIEAVLTGYQGKIGQDKLKIITLNLERFFPLPFPKRVFLKYIFPVNVIIRLFSLVCSLHVMLNPVHLVVYSSVVYYGSVFVQS